MAIDLPPLPHGNGSWAIIQNATGQCVLELFKADARKAQAMNGNAYHAKPIGEYLASLSNREGETPC